ncbi:MAG: DUF2161 family putative PD-(D/E)XK-type phosphodiesterase [Rhizobiaceae bacterium]
MRETDLYQPVKSMLEQQGYTVKAEIGAADVVAMRGDEPPVIVEMKTAFSLALVHQGIERLRITEAVYLATPPWKGRAGWKAFVANRALCRRLGLGLMTVRVETGRVDIHLDPAPYRPRQSPARRDRLLGEFQRRVGDPNAGGSTRRTLMTSYRQDALRCLRQLGHAGPSKAATVAHTAQVARARAIMADDHYGWFERVERGIYALTPRGHQALIDHAGDLETLA